jgi:polyphosphate glucokinase
VTRNSASRDSQRKLPNKKGKGEGVAPYTLAIDVGGTGLKASVLDAAGDMTADRVRVETPRPSDPKNVLAALAMLAASLPPYDRISVGFPGVVRGGRVLTAPNLGTKAWHGFDLAAELERILGKPARVANDADLQGLAVISRRGVEMVLTLGTGFGTGLYWDGRPAPHLELAHHPFRKGKTYEQQLGEAARRKVGKRRWNRRVRLAIDQLRELVCFDRVYLGGGNSKHISFELPDDAAIVSNLAGIQGGIHLWTDRWVWRPLEPAGESSATC